MSRSVWCHPCPIFPQGHSIPARKVGSHELEKRRNEDRRTQDVINPSQPQGDVVTDLETPVIAKLAGLSLTDEVSSLSYPDPDTEEDEIGRLSNLLAAVTLAEHDPKGHQRPSKLWTSREEYQEQIEHNIIPSANEITPADVYRSLESVLHHKTPRPPSSGTRWGHQLWHPTRSAFQKVFRKKIHRTRDYLGYLRQRALDIHARLTSLGYIDHSNTELVAECRQALEVSTKEARSLALSLNTTRCYNDSDFIKRMDEVREALRQVENVISVLGASLPSPSQPTQPILVETAEYQKDPLADKTLIGQVAVFLGVACNLIMGLSQTACDFIIGSVGLIAALAFSAGCSSEDQKKALINQFPSSLHTALGALKLDNKTTVLTVCPKCSFCHKPEYGALTTKARYPRTCNQMVPGETGRVVCGGSLLESRHGADRPVKPFVICSLEEFVARIVSDETLEKLCDDACDDALKHINDPSLNPSLNPKATMNSVFDAEFLRSFPAPVTPPDGSTSLFIDRGPNARLALALHVDFFNPNGVRKRGNHDSIGIISFAILNLPENIRYKPENIFLAGIIPGPREPDYNEMPNYMAPIVDMCLLGWNPGVRLSSTPSQPSGCVVEYAVVISVNDLPAARKVAGASGTNSAYCTVCKGYHRDYNTEFETWSTHDLEELRRNAAAWRDAPTMKERIDIAEATHTRWSEFWRLPYWNPTKMLVVDSMHCILEGLVHYHCRSVLRIDDNEVKKKTTLGPALAYSWPPYDASQSRVKLHSDKSQSLEQHLEQVSDIQEILEYPINCGEGSFTEDTLQSKLSKYRKLPLQYVAATLRVDTINLPALTLLHEGQVITVREQRSDVKLTNKKSIIQALVAWRLKQPQVEPVARINRSAFDHIQWTIRTTVLPTWVNSVPHNYGEHNAGTIKADEWRTLATIFIPIALVTFWGQSTDKRNLDYLRHSMALFQAVTIVCRFSMTIERAEAFRELLRKWVNDLHTIHPHTRAHRVRPNVHAAFHIFDFLRYFGPVQSWWMFPFERLIGVVQKINTNNHIGGELERTILNSFSRAANFRRALNRSHPSLAMKEFQRLFEKAFSSRYSHSESFNEKPRGAGQEHAYYMYCGVNFSRSSTHLGNSLVRYRVQGSSHVGSIEKIVTVDDEVRFHVRRQNPLPTGEVDPFSRYVWFPARSLSASMSDVVDNISPREVLTHVARFEYSEDRVVALGLARD